MRRFPWIAGAIAATAAFGCGQSNVRQDEAALGQLSMESKQPIFTAQHNVEVAQANRATSVRAVDEAKSYQDLAKSEVQSARAKFAAGQKALAYARKAGSPTSARGPEMSIASAERQLAAAQAKKSFADRLVELRQREGDLANEQLAEAETEQALTRASLLAKSGITPRENPAQLVAARDKSLAQIAATEQRIALERGEVEQLRLAWQQRARASQVAARDMGAPLIQPPRAPRELEPEPLPPLTGHPSSGPSERGVPLGGPEGGVQLTPGGTKAPSPGILRAPSGTYAPQPPASEEAP